MSRTTTVKEIDASGAGADSFRIEREREDVMPFYHEGEKEPALLPTVHMQQWLAMGMKLEPFGIVERASIRCEIEGCGQDGKGKIIRLGSDTDPKDPEQLKRALAIQRDLHIYHKHQIQAMWYLSEQAYDRCKALSSRRAG